MFVCVCWLHAYKCHVPWSGMLEMANRSGWCIMLMVNLALNSGSSKQTNALRASTGSICDATSHLFFPAHAHNIKQSTHTVW